MLKANDSGETPLDKCRGSEVEQLIREIAACGGYSNAFVFFFYICTPFYVIVERILAFYLDNTKFDPG